MAENITVVRGDGTLDVFAVVNVNSETALRHAAINPGGGTVISNDALGMGQGINLVDAGWRDNNTQLYVRVYLNDGFLYEWFWSTGFWNGPIQLTF